MHRSLLVLPCLLAVLAAQEPSRFLKIPAATSSDVLVNDPAEDGGIWVRGERYKLGLAAAGATFQPLFGPRAPRDFPLRLALVGVAAGGLEQPLEPGAWHREADHFARSRGLVQECWRCQPAQAQQFFVVQRPTVAGALSLRIAAETDLVGDAAGPGVTFRAGGLGEVHYSDAVVIDAAGQRLAVPVEWASGELRVTVPAGFAAGAAWPIVVDPFLHTVSIEATVSDVEDPRVTIDPATGTVLVVAEEWLSATDADIVCKRYSNAEPPVLLDTVYAANTTQLTHNPDVACLAAQGQFMVAWHNTAFQGTFTGQFEQRSRQVGSTTQGAVGVLSTGIGADLGNRVRVGGSMTGNLWLMVMFRKNITGTDVFAALRNSAGVGFGTAFLGPVANPAAGTVVPGDVSVLQDSTDKWVVVWRECVDTACTSMRVRMQALGLATPTAGPLVTQPTIDLATGTNVDTPSIAGRAGNLLAVWRVENAFQGDIAGVPIGVTAGTVGPLGAVQNLTQQEPGAPLLTEQRKPTVSYDGIRFVYGYLEDNGNDFLRPFASTVLVAGSTIAWHEGHLALPIAGIENVHTLDFAGATSVNQGHHWAVWQEESNLFTGDVTGAIYDARAPGGTSSTVQTGCGLPTEPTIGFSGTPALGRTVTFSIAAPTGFPFFLVGAPQVAPLPGCGSCLAGISLTGMQAIAGSTLPVAVPANAALVGAQLAFQGLVMLQTGGCPPPFLGFAFTLTDTITITLR